MAKKESKCLVGLRTEGEIKFGELVPWYFLGNSCVVKTLTKKERTWFHIWLAQNFYSVQWISEKKAKKGLKDKTIIYGSEVEDAKDKKSADRKKK